MSIERLSDPNIFLKKVYNHLEELKKCKSLEEITKERIKLNLFFSIIRRMINEPSERNEIYLLTHETNPLLIRLAAVRNPPFNLVIGISDDQTIQALADYLGNLHQNPEDFLPGLIAQRDLGSLFCSRYFSHTHQSIEFEFQQLLYHLSDFTPVPSSSGHLVYADESHYELLIEWTVRFKIDAKLPAYECTREQAEKLVKPRLQEKSLVFWEVLDEETNLNTLVSMAGIIKCDEELVRLGMVYTPDEKRKRGYASQLVSAISKELLDQGKQVVLYTDAANPTSNGIYQRIGYHQIAEQCSLGFSDPLEQH